MDENEIERLVHAGAVAMHKQSPYGRPSGLAADWDRDMSDFYRDETLDKARPVVLAVLAALAD